MVTVMVTACACVCVCVNEYTYRFGMTRVKVAIISSNFIYFFNYKLLSTLVSAYFTELRKGQSERCLTQLPGQWPSCARDGTLGSLALLIIRACQ